MDISIIINLIISIALILFLIIKYKLTPFLALISGAVCMGWLSGLGLNNTLELISEGFGDIASGIGFTVALGIIMGQLVSDSGGVKKIADSIVKAAKRENSDRALGLTGFTVSIPVFYDVSFILLTPIARALTSTGKNLPLLLGTLITGIAISHSFIPPTPGPIAGASMVGESLGVILFWGLIVGSISFFVTHYIYSELFIKKLNIWNSDKDKDPNFIDIKKTEVVENQRQPLLLDSLLPIITPILLILLGVVSETIFDEIPDIIQFFTHRIIAMFFGMLLALRLSYKNNIKTDEITISVNKAMGDTGFILLFVGAGGGLGTVFAASGVGEVVVSLVKDLSVPVILLAWLIAALLKVAQGSGTVAMVTAISLLAPSIPEFGIAPVWVAMAAFSGSLACGHVNDSGLWIASKLGGLTLSGALKVYTLPCALVSLISLCLIMTFSFIFS